MPAVTVVIPAYNEAAAIGAVVERTRRVLDEAEIAAEILVVVDGATDDTAAEARQAGARVIEHPLNRGYGRSLKTGILSATHDLIAITDADGTYPVEQLPTMIGLASRYHMIVGARTGQFYQGSLVKWLGRIVFRWLSEFAAGQRIPDINSGLRVFSKHDMVPFFGVISAGFSFTTTSTLAYMLNDYFVYYLPIEYRQRTGRSKVRHLRDSIRALQIIVEAILRYNPIKIFLLAAFPFAAAAGVCLLIGLIMSSGLWALSGVLCGCTAGILLGMGFQAAAVSNRARFSNRMTIPPGGSTAGEPDDPS